LLVGFACVLLKGSRGYLLRPRTDAQDCSKLERDSVFTVSSRLISPCSRRCTATASPKRLTNHDNQRVDTQRLVGLGLRVPPGSRLCPSENTVFGARLRVNRIQSRSLAWKPSILGVMYNGTTVVHHVHYDRLQETVVPKRHYPDNSVYPVS